MWFRNCLLLTIAALACGSRLPAADKPNIVFIFSDDHAYQAISAYGDPRKLVDTPNIDRIGKEGIRFNRAMVPNSICGPSRACVLTGKYSHVNGFIDNAAGARFDGSQVTFPKLLQAAGYQTAMVGKWHLGSDPTGFDFWQILPGQGSYYNPAMTKNGQQVKLTGYTTDIIGDISLDWLKNRDKTKPFCLMSQHKAPHREWEPPARYLGHDKDRKYDEPPTLFDDYSGRGLAEKSQDMTIDKTMTPKDVKLVAPGNLTPDQLKDWNAYYEPRNKAFKEMKLEGKDLVRWKYNRYMHDYTACIKAVDDNVGKLLEYLDKEGLAKNTIVVYSADQGFYTGEHGWFDKRWIFEESLRTPLLVRWPGHTKPGSVNPSDIVSNIDFAPTFLDAAGLPVPAEIHGKSMVKVLEGKTPADWRKSFYYHYYEFPGPHKVRRHYGVVTDRYKLVHFYEPGVDYWELFDRQKDPLELKSVYGQTEYTAAQKELETELARLRKELKVPEKDPVAKKDPATPKKKAKE